MNSSDETIVELSKTKILLALLAAAAFAAAGVHWLSLDADHILTERAFGILFNSPPLVYGIAVLAIAMFVLVLLLSIKKLFDRKPGLVFNSEGILDNASSVSAGMIPWSDVVGSEIFQVQDNKILIIKVKDPEKYFERGSSLKKAINKGGYNGNPIGISTITLKVKFPELVALFNQYHQKYGNAATE